MLSASVKGQSLRKELLMAMHHLGFPLMMLNEEVVEGEVALCRQGGHAARAGCCHSLPPLRVKQVASRIHSLNIGANAVMHLHVQQRVSTSLTPQASSQ